MLNVRKFFELIGGSAVVKEHTGLKRARISQFRTENRLPDAWLRYFRAVFPEQFKQASDEN